MQLPEVSLFFPWARAFQAALAGALFWAAAGCRPVEPSPTGSSPLRVGYAIEAPFAFLAPDGSVTGESPETARRVAARLGRQIEWRRTDFGSLIADLENGRIDVIAAGMFITPERERRIAFSDPSSQVRQGLLVPKGNPMKLDSYEAVAAATNVRVAAIGGSIEVGLLIALGVPETRIVVVPDALAGRVAVESGAADCAAMTLPTVQRMAATPDPRPIEAAEPFRQPVAAEKEGLGRCAFGFRKRDTSLCDAWNRELRAVLGDATHRAYVRGLGMTPLPEILSETSSPPSGLP